MLDKCNVRIPAETPFAPALKDVVAELKYGPVGPFHSNKYYAYSGDVRNLLGLDAIVQLGCRNGKHNHKVDIIDAGAKTLAEIISILTQLFEVDPLGLELMRVDLAADVHDIPVSWFRDHMRVRYKRFVERIEKSSETEVKFVAMGNAEAQTFYAGRDANVIRIYNKTAELKRQWLRLRRNQERFNNGLHKFDLTDEQREFAPVTVPTFEEFCTFQNFTLPADATLTRVERQISGRMPDELRSVDDLSRLPEFRPFEHFKICNSKRSRLPTLSHWSGSVKDYLAVRGLHELIHECGSLQHATSVINRYAKGNGKRIMESLSPFLPSSGFNLTVDELNDIYKRSVMRQICN